MHRLLIPSFIHLSFPLHRCVQCFTYSIEDIPTGKYIYKTIKAPPTVENCKIALMAQGLPESILASLPDNLILSICPRNSLLVIQISILCT